MLKAFTAVLISLLLLVGAATAQAASEEEFHTGRAFVSDQSDAQRESATQLALGQVLTRMTGQEVATNRRLIALQQEAGRYVQQYRYESASDGRLVLVVRFDGESLRKSLGERGVPVWVTGRSSVLVWMAAEDGRRHVLVGAQGTEPLRQAMAQAAWARGVPLMFPLLDVEDMREISFSDVWGGFDETIMAASRRYGTQMVLTGRAYEQSGQWVAHWRLLGSYSDRGWQTYGSSLDEALSNGVTDLARRLSREYTRIPSANESGDHLRVMIENVRDLNDYSRVEKLLAELPNVKRVAVEAAEGEQVSFVLEHQSRRTQLLSALRSQRLLTDQGVLAGTEAGRSRPEEETVYLFRFRQ